MNPADIIDALANRFLAWKLPDDFNPDAGISFDPVFNKGTQYEMRHQPMGTNLLNHTQAVEMIRFIAEGILAEARPAEPDAGKEVWYRGWECGYDVDASLWGAEGWRAYKGGADLDAPQVTARTWSGLLDDIDEREGVQ